MSLKMTSTTTVGSSLCMYVVVSHHVARWGIFINSRYGYHINGCQLALLPEEFLYKWDLLMESIEAIEVKARNKQNSLLWVWVWAIKIRKIRTKNLASKIHLIFMAALCKLLLLFFLAWFCPQGALHRVSVVPLKISQAPSTTTTITEQSSDRLSRELGRCIIELTRKCTTHICQERLNA